METNKITDDNSNMHLSMIADPTKIINEVDNKLSSLDINSPNNNDSIIEKYSNNETSDDNISNISKNSSDLINNIDKDFNNDNKIETNIENNTNRQFIREVSSDSSPIENNNFPNNNFNDQNETSVKTPKNIDASRFNINPDTIPFENLDDKAKKFKKMEKLAKLIELKNRGFNLTKNYSMESNYDEMCFEIDYWQKYQTKKDGVELGKSFLMNAVTAIEFLNDRYDPFSFKLNGWSENVRVNSDSYTDVFSELYDKYKITGKKMEPEIKLILMLSASAVTFHASKSLTNSIPIPGSENIFNSISSKINSSISGENNNNETYNTKQQELYETMKKQQSELIKKQQEAEKDNTPIKSNDNNKDLKSFLNNLKNNNNYENNSSSLSVSSTVTLGSEKSNKPIIKINTK